MRMIKILTALFFQDEDRSEMPRYCRKGQLFAREELRAFEAGLQLIIKKIFLRAAGSSSTLSDLSSSCLVLIIGVEILCRFPNYLLTSAIFIWLYELCTQAVICRFYKWFMRLWVYTYLLKKVNLHLYEIYPLYDQLIKFSSIKWARFLFLDTLLTVTKCLK